MKTAFYGYGRHGRKIINMVTQALLPWQELPVIFDAAFSELNTESGSPAVSDPDLLERYYREGKIKEVFVTVNREPFRQEIEEKLQKTGIPTISFRELAVRLTGAETDLYDEETSDILEARAAYALNGSWDGILDAIEKYKAGRTYTAYALSDFMEKNRSDEVILFGTGEENRINSRILALCGIKAAASVNIDNKESLCSGAMIRKILNEHGNAALILNATALKHGWEEILVRDGADQDRIFKPYSFFVSGMRSGQYFDVWQPGNECFIDCGAYNGDTVRAFMNWTHWRCRQITALEPLEKMLPVLESIKSKCPHLTILSAAAWDTTGTGTIVVHENDAGSYLEGTCSRDPGIETRKIRTAALDDVIDGPVTLIKMDIEGSEWEALHGAAGLIRKWKPRLAISVYHKPCDAFLFPKYLKELVPEYRFRIRHYGADIMETVLYASINDFKEDRKNG